MNVIAQAVAFVIVLIAADVEQVKLVNQSDTLEHIERAIDGDAVDVRDQFSGRDRELLRRPDADRRYPSLELKRGAGA